MTTWIVDDSNNGDFLTIAEAIAAASMGDKIIVTGGDDNIHEEANIVVNKELTIKSDSNGATIDAQGAGRVFLIDDGDETTKLEVKLKDLTITGGVVGSDDPEAQQFQIGAGILNLEKLTVKDSIITNVAFFDFYFTLYIVDTPTTTINSSILADSAFLNDKFPTWHIQDTSTNCHSSILAHSSFLNCGFSFIKKPGTSTSRII